MKRISVLCLALLCIISVQAGLQKNDAMRMIEKVTNDSISEIWIANQQFTKGDTIILWNGHITCPFKESWLVFVDYHPMRNWAHDCSYFYVDINSGEYSRIDRNVPPQKLSNEWTKYKSFVAPNRGKTSLLQRLLSSNSTLITHHRTQSVPEISEPTNSHLYAIIIDFCGSSTEYNHERLWNDCATMYGTFLNNGYPRENIYVAMPDGSEGMPLLHLTDGRDIPSPTDLDGDGYSDVRYPATGNGVDNLLYDISHVLTENDILTVYLTGHGNFPLDYSFSYGGWLADDVSYSDSYLVRQLLELNVNILNFIVQRNIVFSFTNVDDPHYCNNILTLNPHFYAVLSTDDVDDATPNYQIDGYTERLADAVNGNVMECDLNGDGYISMHEAHTYATSNNSTNPSYRPYQESWSTCVKYDLSLTGTLPSNPCIQTDLYMKDNYADFGGEPNTSTELSYISPDIWVEDLNGNVVNTLMSNETYNVCVRIRNRGSEDSHGNETLHVHWTKAVIGGKWPDSWNDGGVYDCNGTSVNTGMEITPSEGFALPVIPAYGEYIARVEWTTPNNNNYAACSEFINNIHELWHYCLLARLYEENDTPGLDMVYQPMNTFVLNSNNVVSKNITIMNHIDNNLVGSVVSVVAPYSGDFDLSGRLYSYYEDLLNEGIVINLYLDDNLYANWNGDGTGFVNHGDRIQITNPTFSLQEFHLDESVLYTLKVEVENGDMPDFRFDITLTDEYGVKLGGESFQYIEAPAFSAPQRRNESGISETSPNDISYDSNAAIQKVTVMNALGQIVTQTKNPSQINLKGLSSGIYIIVVEFDNESKQYKTIQL